MADSKVSALPAVTTAADADLLYVLQSSTDKKMSLETLRKLIPNTPTAVFGDGSSGASLSAGLTCFVRVPYGGTIAEWVVVSNATCTCVIDVWKASGALPTNANSITASAKPSLSATSVNGSNTLTGWTTSVSEGDVLGFELESFSGTVSQITLTLKVI